MVGDVFDTFAIDPDLTVVVQAVEELLAGKGAHGLTHVSLLQDLAYGTARTAASPQIYRG
jgi:hypothetical protein